MHVLKEINEIQTLIWPPNWLAPLSSCPMILTFLVRTATSARISTRL